MVLVPPPPSDPAFSSSRPAGPILALDLGRRRTGLARSDPGRRVAFGLPTFEVRPGRSLKEHLRNLLREEPLGGVVLGFPLHENGSPGELAGTARRLGAWIRSELNLPVAYWDERLTSWEASEMLQEGKKSRRREKGAVDQVAAQLILREFLQAGCPFPQDAGD